MDQQTIIEIGRISLEAICGIGLIIAGGKYQSLFRVLLTVLQGVEISQNKDVKKSIQYISVDAKTDDQLNNVLKDLEFLNRSGKKHDDTD